MAKEPFAARLTSIWIGAAFFWMINGFKGTYKAQVTEKFETRNLWTGYIIMILCLIAIVFYAFVGVSRLA